jgi:hypothetical protein
MSSAAPVADGSGRTPPRWSRCIQIALLLAGGSFEGIAWACVGKNSLLASSAFHQFILFMLRRSIISVSRSVTL